jgi:hypothetical protein
MNLARQIRRLPTGWSLSYAFKTRSLSCSKYDCANATSKKQLGLSLQVQMANFVTHQVSTQPFHFRRGLNNKIDPLLFSTKTRTKRLLMPVILHHRTFLTVQQAQPQVSHTGHARLKHSTIECFTDWK